MPTAVVIGSLLLFACFWCGLLALLARISGWTAIAAQYRATGAKDGRALRMQSARFGWIDYNGCLSIRVSDEGLRISIWPFFCSEHPPLFLPWSALHVVEVREGRWQRDVTLNVGTPPIARVRLALKVLEEAGRLPAHPDGTRN
jgi:hypothetical protein